MGYSMNVEKCERCGEPTNGITTMSMFNTDVICMKCKEAEKLRPDYNKAVDADVAEIKKGNYNFEGIGFAKGGGVERTEMYVLGKDKKYADEVFKRAGIKPSKISEKQDEIIYGVDGIYTYYFSNITDRERAFSYLHGLFANGGVVDDEIEAMVNDYGALSFLTGLSLSDVTSGWRMSVPKLKQKPDGYIKRLKGNLRKRLKWEKENSLSIFEKLKIETMAYADAHRDDKIYLRFDDGGELPTGVITKGQIQKVYKAAGFDTEKIRRTKLNDGWFVYYAQANPYFHASGVVSDWIPDDVDAGNMMEMYIIEARSRHKMPALTADDLRNIFLAAGVNRTRSRIYDNKEDGSRYTTDDYEMAANIINTEINIGNIPYQGNRNRLIEPLAKIINVLRGQGILPQNFNQHDLFNDYLASLKIYKPVDAVYEMEVREPVEMLAKGGAVIYDQLLKEIDDEIKKIDWSFQFSDDFRYWQSGESHRKKVSKMISDILKKNPELYEQIRKKMWASYKKQYTSKEDIWGIDSVMEDAKAGRVSMAKGGNVSKAEKYEAEMQALYKRKMKYADGGNVYLHDYKVGDVLKEKIPDDVNPAVKKYLQRMQKTKKITGIDYTDGSVEINNRPFDKMKISWLDWLIQNKYEYIPA